MRLGVKTAVTCGLLLGLAACNSFLWPGTATLRAGCYTLTDRFGQPMALQLTEDPWQDRPGWMWIYPLPEGATRFRNGGFDVAGWTATGDLLFGGLGGLKASLRGSESPFEGRAESRTDIDGADPIRYSVTLESIACPEWDEVPTSVNIAGQSVELSARAVTDPSGTLLDLPVSLDLAGGLPGDVTGVGVEHLWVVRGDKVWQTAVYRSESKLWRPLSDISIPWWEPGGALQVVALLLDNQSGNHVLVRDTAVPFTHAAPAP